MTSITTLLKRIDEQLFVHRDRLTYEIKSEGVYEKILKHEDLFDFCKYPKDTRFFDQANKSVIGEMKEAFEGKAISEFVGLNSKMHSMKTIDGKESNTGKGANFATAFNEFKDPLFNKKVVRHKVKRIQKTKNIRLEHTKSTKYHYRVLVIKDLL